MSPVSRSRKNRKSRHGNRSGGNRAVISPLGPPRPARIDGPDGPGDRPQWFEGSITNVLDRADDLMAASGPRELDDAAARLLGGELHHRLNAETAGFWFDRWFADLAEAAAIRTRETVADPDRPTYHAYLRLLHAMTGLGSPSLAGTAHTRLAQATKGLPRELRNAQPSWLHALSKITATGQLWQAHDAYGGRIAVIAGFTYPAGADPSVFLFDIDACGYPVLAGAGSYDDVDQAAAAWRAAVGPTADHQPPVPVDEPENLHALVHWDNGEELMGDESRTVMDNWFRARRRLHDLAHALRRQRTPLPTWRNLYQDLHAEPAIEAFTRWYTERHDVGPDPDATEAVAHEWLEGALPGTEHVVAPARIRHIRGLMTDWIPDDPVTVAARALLPDWIRWNAEQDHLPPHLLDRALEAAGSTR